jgi:transcriptional regulator with XRE-family HTH domain
MHQYLSGKSEPTRPVLAAIARAGGVSVSWLAVGEVEEHASQVDRSNEAHLKSSIKASLLTQVIAGVENGLNELELSLDATKKAELISLLYEHFLPQDQVEQETLKRFIRLAS